MNLRFIISLLTIVFTFSIHTPPAFAAGNPYLASHGVNFASGNKYHKETDISIDGSVFPLTFTRHYNSQSTVNGDLGYGWSHSYSEKIAIIPSTATSPSKIKHTRPDGRVVTYNYDSGATAWIKENGKYAKITKTSTEYHLFQNGYTTHIFDSDDDITGKIIQRLDRSGNSLNYTYATDELKIEDNFGRLLTLTYISGRLDTLTIPDIGDFTYNYDGEGNLWKVTRPGATKFREYFYEDTDVHNLTGVKDEELRSHLDTVYDTSDRVTNISLQGNSHPISIQYRPYPDTNQRIVTDNDEVTTYELTYRFGIAQVESVTGPGCTSCGLESGSTYLYNDKLQVESITDNDEIETEYGYDGNGNRNRITEANLTGLERTTMYAYNPTSNLLETISRDSVANPGQLTTVTWGYIGNQLDYKQEDGYRGTTSIGRFTDYEYDTLGRIEKIDGPRVDLDNDVVDYVYYPNDGSNQAGMPYQIIRGANPSPDDSEHITEFTNYNALRKATTIIDPNGVQTDLVYNDFGQVTEKTVDFRTTFYHYDDAGVLESIDLPDSRSLTYGYWLSGKVETITDARGNFIKYSYDYGGNLTDREIHDPGSVLTAAIHHTYAPNHLLHKTWNNVDTDELIPSEKLEYDSVGNLWKRNVLKDSFGPNIVTTEYVYDDLRRLTDIMVNPGATPVTTSFEYDRHDNRKTVTDAKNNPTAYIFDDFGRWVSRASPDSGTTSYQYDDSDNLTQKSDENGKVLDYAYDRFNRLLTVKSGVQLLQSYTYDQNDDEGGSQKGFLTFMNDEPGDATFKYNTYGELVKEVRVTNSKTFTTQYGYTNNGELKAITYPSGRIVTYNRDTAGQLSSIESEYESVTGWLAQNIQSRPFGPITDMDLGNGKQVSNGYDSLYRLGGATVGDLYNRAYVYHSNSQVKDITDFVGPNTQSFSYDILDQLDIADATGTYGNIDFDFDDVGNRESKIDSSGTTTYSYLADTNKLDQISGTPPVNYTHDGAGNIINMDVPDNDVYSWTDDNRLALVKKNSATVESYQYDGMGRRAVKDVTSGDDTLFVYGQSGEMLVEADDQGYIDREYVYLNGAPFVHFQYNPGVVAQSVAL